MHGTIHTDDLGTDVYAAVTGVARRDLVEPDVVPSFDADTVYVDTEPGTVMLSAAHRHRQLEIVARRLVEAAHARRARLN